jgi:uncharacterized protein (TIGR03067 family)
MPATVVHLAEWGLKSLSRHGLRMAIALPVVVGLVALLGGLFLRPRPVDVSIPDRLQGTWDEASLNINGIQIDRPQAQVIFKDDQMTLSDTVGTFRIDAAKDPMQLDWTVQGRVSHMIFKLQEDELTLCISQPLGGGPADQELPRPQDFSPQQGKLIMVFRRLPR